MEISTNGYWNRCIMYRPFSSFLIKLWFVYSTVIACSRVFKPQHFLAWRSNFLVIYVEYSCKIRFIAKIFRYYFAKMIHLKIELQIKVKRIDRIRSNSHCLIKPISIPLSNMYNQWKCCRHLTSSQLLVCLRFRLRDCI